MGRGGNKVGVIYSGCMARQSETSDHPVNAIYHLTTGNHGDGTPSSPSPLGLVPPRVWHRCSVREPTGKAICGIRTERPEAEDPTCFHFVRTDDDALMDYYARLLSIRAPTSRPVLVISGFGEQPSYSSNWTDPTMTALGSLVVPMHMTAKLDKKTASYGYTDGR